MNLLKKLFRGLFGGRLERAPVAPDWGAVEQVGWSRFLSSATGQCLAARMRAVELRNYQTAADDSMHTAYAAARAKGFEDARRWLESLSRTACVTAEAAGAVPGDLDMPPPEGEAELHERMSP